MSELNNIITDKEIHDLFKQRMLETDMDDALNQKLIDMETQIAFSNDLLFMPDLQKEKELLTKLSSKTGFGSWSTWLYTGLSCTAIAVSVLVYNASKTSADKPQPVSMTKAETIINNIQPAEALQNIAPANNPVVVNEAHDNPPPVINQNVIPTVDTIALAEKAPENKKPDQNKQENSVPYFTGAYGTNQSVTKLPNDSNTISVDTVFRGIKRVEIDGSFCDVNIKTHTENQVSLKGEMKMEFKGLIMRKPEYRLLYSQKDSVLTVSIQNMKKSSVMIVGSCNYSGHLDLVMPKRTALHIRNASGNVIVNGIEGENCYLGSAYGDVKADHIKSKVEIHSSSGNINLSDIAGEVICKASYGNIDFKDLTGDLKISSSSGNVKINNLRGNMGISCSYGNVDLSKINGNVSVTSSSGYVSADNITANKVNVSCNYGHVKISNTTASVSVKSSSGKINLQHITGNVSAHASYGNMILSDITGDVVLGSSSGGIDISKQVGRMVIASNYGDINASDCISQISIKSASGDIRGKNIQLVKDFVAFATYGDIEMNLKNDVSELSFDLSSGSGNLKLDKNGIKLNGKEGKLFMQKGDILVKSVSSSGNQTFD